jgi:hypothetical protein
MLLNEIPVACNSKYDPQTLVAERMYWKRTFVELRFHLAFKFTPGCQIRIRGTFYERMSYLGEAKKRLLYLQKRPPRPFVYETTKETVMERLERWLSGDGT